MKRAILTALLLGSAGFAEAQEAPRSEAETGLSLTAQTNPAPETEPPSPATPPPTVLEPVVVSAPPPVSASSEMLIPGKDFELRPQGRPADILRLVPGLIIS